MMFQLNEFIMKVLRGMVGREPNYRIMQYAAGWYDKSVLTIENLEEVDRLIEEHDSAAQKNLMQDAADEGEGKKNTVPAEISGDE